MNTRHWKLAVSILGLALGSQACAVWIDDDGHHHPGYYHRRGYYHWHGSSLEQQQRSVGEGLVAQGEVNQAGVSFHEPD